MQIFLRYEMIVIISNLFGKMLKINLRLTLIKNLIGVLIMYVQKATYVLALNLG